MCEAKFCLSPYTGITPLFPETRTPLHVHNEVPRVCACISLHVFVCAVCEVRV
jgi:hypothetical protein